MNAGSSGSGSPRRLSVGQEALWFLHRLAPGSAAYNVALAVRIRSRLDERRLASAVAAVEDRHDVLRSTFTEVDGLACRVVQPSDGGRPVLEVRAVPWADDEDLHALAHQSSTVPFGLTAGGRAFRVVLLRRRPDDAALVVAAHHIVADASSLLLMLRDLLRAYRALEADATTPVLAHLRHSYDDFVAMERRMLDSARGTRLRAYWRGVCAAAPAARLLPDRPAPARPNHGGATCELRMPNDFTARLRAATAARGHTPFAGLLGAFQALLHRCTGQTDFLIGTASSLRFVPGLRDVVGHMANSLPLAASFGATTTMAHAIASAARQIPLALAHAAYPFPLMAAASDAPPDAERPPLFRITLTMLQVDRLDPPLLAGAAGAPEGAEIEYAGLRLAHMDLPQQEGQFDLSVELRHSNASLTGVFRYDTDLFERATVEALADRFSRFAQSAVTEPATCVADIPLVQGSELDRLLALGGG